VAETDTKKTYSECHTGARSLHTPRHSSRKSKRMGLYLQSHPVKEIMEEDEADNSHTSKLRHQHHKLSTPRVNSVASALTAREAVSEQRLLVIKSQIARELEQLGANKGNGNAVNLGGALDKQQIVREVKGLAQEVGELEQREEWLLRIKTHIAKY